VSYGSLGFLRLGFLRLGFLPLIAIPQSIPAPCPKRDDRGPAQASISQRPAERLAFGVSAGLSCTQKPAGQPILQEPPQWPDRATMDTSKPQPQLASPSTLSEKERAAIQLVLSARKLIESGNTEVAMIDLGKALRIAGKNTPEYAAAASDLGVLHLRNERPDLARGFLEAALEAAPDNELTQSNMRDFQANAPKHEKPLVADNSTGGPSATDHWVLTTLNDCDQLIGFAGKDVLEIGGSLPPEVAQALEPKSWTSVDPMATQSTVANHRVLCAGAEEIPVADNSFDLAFSCCAFEHIPDLPSVLKEASRVLRPGGVLFSQFSPIWSSWSGNHVWVRGIGDETPSLTFSDGALPPWAHLLWDRKDLAAFVEPTHGAEHAESAAFGTYGHPHINRLFEDDFYRIFDECPLTVEQLEKYGGVRHPGSELLARLKEAHPTRQNFSSSGLMVVMRKPR
jgi:SAM-dependent methyltransferase